MEKNGKSKEYLVNKNIVNHKKELFVSRKGTRMVLFLCIFILTAFFIYVFRAIYSDGITGKEAPQNRIVEWKTLHIPIDPNDKAENTVKLYAQAAVLMDADTGRILYGKMEEKILPMASTTKIMTCILALELAKDEEVICFSPYAASMPKVKMYGKAGEEFALKDLLRAMMLESYNDVAVAIAENIGDLYCADSVRIDENDKPTLYKKRNREESIRAVDHFVEKMNEKAREIGCEHTLFFTPNGLDASKEVVDENGEVISVCHSTTAEDLAKIMRYCVEQSSKREEFLKVTRERSISFASKSGKNYLAGNKNLLLDMNAGAESGKTGFTCAAGYCYVASYKDEEKHLIIALLNCGDPGRKKAKWQDSLALIQYANQRYKVIETEEFINRYGQCVREQIPDIYLENKDVWGRISSSPVQIQIEKGVEAYSSLLAEGNDEICCEILCNTLLEGTVEDADKIGEIIYKIDGIPLRIDKIKASSVIEEGN